MDKENYDRQLLKWIKGHYWDSLEKDKHLILRHLRTFLGDIKEDPECEHFVPPNFCTHVGDIVQE